MQVLEDRSTVIECYHTFFCEEDQGEQGSNAMKLTQTTQWGKALRERTSTGSTGPKAVILDFYGGEKAALAAQCIGLEESEEGMTLLEKRLCLEDELLKALQNMGTEAQRAQQALTLIVNTSEGPHGSIIARQLCAEFGAENVLMLLDEDPNELTLRNKAPEVHAKGQS